MENWILQEYVFPIQWLGIFQPAMWIYQRVPWFDRFNQGLSTWLKCPFAVGFRDIDSFLEDGDGASGYNVNIFIRIWCRYIINDRKYIFGCVRISMKTIHNYSVVASVAWIYHELYIHPIQVFKNVVKYGTIVNNQLMVWSANDVLVEFQCSVFKR